MSFTVLIADDEAMPRTVLKEHIPWEELSVTQVHLATDGEEAVEQARRAADGCGVPRPTLGNLPKPGSRAFPPYRWYTIRAA